MHLYKKDTNMKKFILLCFAVMLAQSCVTIDINKDPYKQKYNNQSYEDSTISGLSISNMRMNKNSKIATSKQYVGRNEMQIKVVNSSGGFYYIITIKEPMKIRFELKMKNEKSAIDAIIQDKSGNKFFSLKSDGTRLNNKIEIINFEEAGEYFLRFNSERNYKGKIDINLIRVD